jgi:archaellum component FlaC
MSLTKDDLQAIRQIVKEEGEQTKVELLGYINDLATLMDERFDKVDERFAQVDKRFAQADKRFISIDERFNQIDKKMEVMNKRIEEVNNTIYREINSLRQDFQEELRDREHMTNGDLLGLLEDMKKIDARVRKLEKAATL